MSKWVSMSALGASPLGGQMIVPGTVQIVNPPAGSTLSADGKTLTVPGEGVWTVDAVAGAITFSPAAGYSGQPDADPVHGQGCVGQHVQPGDGDAHNRANCCTSGELCRQQSERLAGLVDKNPGSVLPGTSVVAYAPAALFPQGRGQP